MNETDHYAYKFRNSTGNVFPTQMWVMKCSQWQQKKYIPYGQFLCLWVLYKNIFWECISHVASWQPCQWLVLLVQFTDLKASVDFCILSTTATRTQMKGPQKLFKMCPIIRHLNSKATRQENHSHCGRRASPSTCTCHWNCHSSGKKS